jgi:hypothetical protein
MVVVLVANIVEPQEKLSLLHIQAISVNILSHTIECFLLLHEIVPLLNKNMNPDVDLASHALFAQ